MTAHPVLALFDLDDTLIDRTAAFARWARDFLDAHGADPDDLAWLLAADDHGQASRHALFSAVRSRYGLDRSVDSLLEDYFEALLSMYEPDDRVTSCLEQLRQAGWRIGVVTNGSERWQAAKLAAVGLLPLLDGCCVSEEVGARKPDPRIFQEAARRCGTVLEGWMVGDDATNDIGGASAAGLRAAWISRGREWPTGFAPPALRVADVPAAVEAILSGDPAAIGSD